MTLPVLRRLVDQEVLRDLWRRTLAAAAFGERPCPSCHRAMFEVEPSAAGGLVPLDVCPGCQLVWFDATEFERLPAASAAPVALRPTYRRLRRDVPSREANLSGLRLLPAILGMPVELEEVTFRARPFGTWILAVVVVVVSIVGFSDPVWIDRLALVPADALRFGGLTALSAFFVHGSVLHLAGNMWFFVTFGDNVEDYLGRARWLALVVAATVVGALFHVLGDPGSEVPCVGASGGISGLIAFYALRFPRARLGSYFWFLLIPHWITFPAWGGFLFWMVSQAVLLWQQLAGFGNVSALAHLGGALVGLLAWLLWRDN